MVETTISALLKDPYYFSFAEIINLSIVHMATVSEKSFRTLYIVSLVIVLLMFIATIFYYIQFRKVEDRELHHQDVVLTKNLSLIFAVISALGVVVLTILFFGLPRWMK